MYLLISCPSSVLATLKSLQLPVVGTELSNYTTVYWVLHLNIIQLPLCLFPRQRDNEFQHLESNFHLGMSSLQLMIQFKKVFVEGWESHNRMHHYLINEKETKQVLNTHWP